MNIPRFILPATVAATLHVALFRVLPHEEYVRLVPVILGPEKPPPPEDPVTLPPAEKTIADEPFRQIAGGPGGPFIRPANSTACPTPGSRLRPSIRWP